MKGDRIFLWGDRGKLWIHPQAPNLYLINLCNMVVHIQPYSVSFNDTYTDQYQQLKDVSLKST